DDRERGGGRLADAQGEEAGGPAHADDEVPARRGAGVLGQVADDGHAQVPGRLEAERRRGAGQRQVVVDGLGDVGDADRAAGPPPTSIANRTFAASPLMVPSYQRNRQDAKSAKKYLLALLASWR